jgi:hypothetical protein
MKKACVALLNVLLLELVTKLSEMILCYANNTNSLVTGYS